MAVVPQYYDLLSETAVPNLDALEKMKDGDTEQKKITPRFDAKIRSTASSSTFDVINSIVGDEFVTRYRCENGNVVMILDVPKFILKFLEGEVQVISQTKSSSDETFQLVFQTRQPADRFLIQLKKAGLGNRFGSVYVLPVSLSAKSTVLRKTDSEFDSSKSIDGTFRDTIRERGFLHQLLDQVYSQVRFSFDFLMMAISAGILAAVGLATDSDVIIVASMLVSPIMGPILGLCFGIVIYDVPLIKRALWNEIRALAVCIIVGFLCGIAISANADEIRSFSNIEYPTPNMVDRGRWGGLIIGLAIAIPSGIGVALSVTGSNTPALVGVAISAALLPPAVNCGLLLAHSIFRNVFPVKLPKYSNWEIAELGIGSFVLTVLNIFVIVVTAAIMFRIKEVVPIPGKSEFWDHFVPELKREVKKHDEKETLRHVEEIHRTKVPTFYVNPSFHRDYSMSWRPFVSTETQNSKSNYNESSQVQDSNFKENHMRKPSLLDIFSPNQMP